MGKIITENFRVDVAKELVESLDTENYYAVASRAINKTEALSADDIANTQFSQREFQRQVIFGKKIDVARRGNIMRGATLISQGSSGSNSVRYMFADNPWEEGRVYDAFDDTLDVETLDMVVSVASSDGEGFVILKCIDNNNGAPSTDIAAEIDTESYSYFEGADGYVWYPMFVVSNDEASDYRTTGSLPVAEFVTGEGGYGDENVSAKAVESVSRIIIENTQASQFNQYLFGPATSIHDASDVRIENPDSSTIPGPLKKVVVSATSISGRTLYSTDDSYKNMYLRDKTNGTLYEVKASKTLLASNSIVLDIETNDNFVAQALYQLVIKINVSASTLTGERCTAYGKIDQFGTLVGIGFGTRGTEYKYAKAEVVYPPNLKQSVSVAENPTTLRVVVSPTGGHGSNPISELATSKVTMVSTFLGESEFVPDTNTYSVVGLLKNPEFTGNDQTPSNFDNRTKLQISGNALFGGDLVGGGDEGDYIEQYIETIDIKKAQNGVSYTIVDKGNISEDTLWSSLGATTSSDIGGVFTMQNIETLDSSRYAKVSFARDAVDTTASTYDYSIEVVKARIHQLEYSNSMTTIYLVDYDGDFKHKFQKGKIYIKSSPSSTSFINNVTIESITYGNYVPYSGELLHFIDFTPITRSEGKNEKIKFTFDF